MRSFNTGRRGRADQEKRWRRTQREWDDAAYLLERAGGCDHLRWERLEEVAARFLPAAFGARLLDVGAGRGGFAAPARAAGLDYFAVEPSWKMNVKAEAGVLAHYARGRAEELPFRDGVFRAVLIKEALDHCSLPAAALAEAARVLAPGGRLLVTVGNSRAYYRRLFGWLVPPDREHLHHFSPSQLGPALAAAGFRRVGWRCCNYLRWPRKLEGLALFLLGRRAMRALLAVTDVWGRWLWPAGGGTVIAWGDKE